MEEVRSWGGGELRIKGMFRRWNGAMGGVGGGGEDLGRGSVGLGIFRILYTPYCSDIHRFLKLYS
jgi:hypothetical protein